MENALTLHCNRAPDIVFEANLTAYMAQLDSDLLSMYEFHRPFLNIIILRISLVISKRIQNAILMLILLSKINDLAISERPSASYLLSVYCNPFFSSYGIDEKKEPDFE
jgi:hypothetical protein